jgi:DNA-binding transcriptional ArsR family regulator
MTRSAPPSTEFVVTPRFEVFYALYTLTSSASTPLDPWKERARTRLPRDFERIAKRVAPVPLFWPLLADALQRTPGEITFAEILSALQEMPADELKANIISGILHDPVAVKSLVTGETSLRQILTRGEIPGGELLTHFGLKPYSAASQSTTAIVRLLTNPASFRDELILVLNRFWETGFERDWSLLEPTLRAESFHLEDLHESGSLDNFGRDLNLPVAFDEKEGELRPKAGPVIEFDRLDHLYVMPSAFNTRRWWARYETRPQRFSIYFPIARDAASPNNLREPERKTREPSRGSRPPVNAESVFRALGDTTRYAIASVLARTPTTSAELARSLRVSKPTITHHVQALRAAGLIEDETAGGSTRLSLNRETVAGLSDAAVEHFFSSTGDVALATTRKRSAEK